MPWVWNGNKPGGLKGRESGRHDLVCRALAALQAAPFLLSFTQGIGLRPQPWAPFSRPGGPEGPTTLKQS